MKFQPNYIFDDCVGKTYGYVTPIREVNEKAKDGSKQWEFECVCGKKFISAPYRVISGHKKSCGCKKYSERVSHKKGVKNKIPRVNPEEFIGKRSNHLVCIGYEIPDTVGRLSLVCKCDCGKTTKLFPYQFRNGKIQSCGCAKEHIWNGSRNIPWLTKHGYSHDRLYKKYLSIKQRCYNKNAENYDRYGGRGIKVCDEWVDNPDEFIKWAVSTGGLDETLTIDRIDVNGPYAPWNCRWVTQKEQSRNKRSNVNLTYNGETKCLADWANEYGMNYETLRGRLKAGWSIEKALTTPVRKYKPRT